MAEEVILPKTGLNVEDVHLIEWLVEEGTTVDAGQALLVMETDKVEVEVEAEAAGLLHRKQPAGADYPVGSVVGYIAADEDEYRQLAVGIGR